MDPHAALVDALDELNEANSAHHNELRRRGHKEAAAEFLRNLADWLDHGGFAPVVTYHDGEYIIPKISP